MVELIDDDGAGIDEDWQDDFNDALQNRVSDGAPTQGQNAQGASPDGADGVAVMADQDATYDGYEYEEEEDDDEHGEEWSDDMEICCVANDDFVESHCEL